MYTDYFGLREKPFSISPDPRYLYMSEHHREALAHLLYGIGNDGCLILLTGDVGTGKTTVCRSLLEQLPENTQAAIIVNPKLNVKELLQTICEELKIIFDAQSNSVKHLIDAITRGLLQAHAEGKTTLLIIDEAQNLDMDVLEQLRLLTNLETETTKLLKIILIGQPELQTKLESPEVAQINQRITSRYHLGPLKEKDAWQFIRHRLIVAGGGRMEFFSQEALQLIFLISGGIPRLINILCDRSLLGAFVEEVNQVTGEIVRKAAGEVLGHTYQPPKSTTNNPRIRKTSIALVVTLCILVLLLLLRFSQLSPLSPLFSGESLIEDVPVVEENQPVTDDPEENEEN